jgi:predicted esterase
MRQVYSPISPSYSETKQPHPCVTQSVLHAAIASLILCNASQGPYDFRKDPKPIPRQPYFRYFTHDKFNREITFYVTEPSGSEASPLTIYIQGSGCGSNFVERDGRIVPQNGHASVFDAAEKKVRLLIVEKPGVDYLDPGSRGSASTASEKFKKEHTLERWSEAVTAALKASTKIEGLDRSRILVMGHSEGGLVACKVAADNSEVTHCATLAGGGVTQPYDLIQLARKGVFAARISEDPEKRAEYLVSEWRKVLAEPDAWDKDYLGHPYRRWSSFLATSPIEELAKFRGKIFIGQGTDDQAVDVSSADALYSQLISRGKDVRYDRVADADHGFTVKGQTPGEGWRAHMKRVLDWFLK